MASRPLIVLLLVGALASACAPESGQDDFGSAGLALSDVCQSIPIPTAVGAAYCATPGDWKAKAWAMCADHSLSLSDVSFDAPCMAGDQDGFKQAAATCCKTAPAPSPEPACFDGGVHLDWCIDPATLKAKAASDCAAADAQLKKVSFQWCADGSAKGVDFACCAADAPTPEPEPETDAPSCMSDVMGGPTSCKPPATWKEYAHEACQSQGMALKTLDFGDKCDWGYGTAKFQCCSATDAAPTPEAGDPPTCAKVMAEPKMCLPKGAWKAHAIETCQAWGDGAWLDRIKLGGACAKGDAAGFSQAKLRCCTYEPIAEPAQCKGRSLRLNQCAPKLELLMKAAAHCGDHDAALNTANFGDKCLEDKAKTIKFECCKAAD